LTIAQTEYPDLDIERYISRLDELANRAEALINEVGDSRTWQQVVSEAGRPGWDLVTPAPSSPE
jgi:hypothetical protein